MVQRERGSSLRDKLARGRRRALATLVSLIGVAAFGPEAGCAAVACRTRMAFGSGGTICNRSRARCAPRRRDLARRQFQPQEALVVLYQRLTGATAATAQPMRMISSRVQTQKRHDDKRRQRQGDDDAVAARSGRPPARRA